MALIRSKAYIVYECPYRDWELIEIYGGRIHGVCANREEAEKLARKVTNKIINEGLYNEENPTHGHMAVLEFPVKDSWDLKISQRQLEICYKDVSNS